MAKGEVKQGMESYEHEHEAQLEITWEKFGGLCDELALAVDKDFNCDAVVGIAKAGSIVGAVVAAKLRKDFYPIKLSRREMDEVVRKHPIVYIGPTDHVKGKRILLVDEISVTGRTLRMAEKELKKKGAREIKTATLFVHRFSYKPDFYALESDSSILNPWDLKVVVNGELKTHPEYLSEG